MTVNDIIRESNTIKLSDFVCLTSIQTQEDIKKLTKQGYDVGYTQSEWEKEYSLPANKIFYAKSMYSSVYQTKAGKAHDFNRGMKGRTLELLWEKFQNNFVYIHVFVTTWHLKYDIIDT